MGFTSLFSQHDIGKSREPSPTLLCKDEATVLIHGTLFVYIRAATMLGRSGLAQNTGHEPNEAQLPRKIVQGARFVGKKMLNAVRATNQVATFPIVVTSVTERYVTQGQLQRVVNVLIHESSSPPKVKRCHADHQPQPVIDFCENDVKGHMKSFTNINAPAWMG
jgi:hypothetical protein